MASNARVFDELIALRGKQMRESAAVLANDFGFREALAIGDHSTLASSLSSLRDRSGAGIALVVQYDGQIIASAQAPAIDSASLWPALDAGHDSGMVKVGGKIALAVAAPIMVPDLAGWLVLVQPLDGRELRQITKLAAIPITAQVLTAQQVTGPLASLPLGRVESRSIRGEEVLYRLSVIPSLQQGLEPRLMLRHSLTQALADYQTLKHILAVIALAGVALAGWFATRLASDIARPLAALAVATRRFGAGEVAQGQGGKRGRGGRPGEQLQRDGRCDRRPRAQDHPYRAARWADQPAQSPPFHRAARICPGASAGSDAHSGRLHRPRQFQVNQRHAWPSGGRRTAQAGCRSTSGQVPERRGRPFRGRRIRRPVSCPARGCGPRFVGAAVACLLREDMLADNHPVATSASFGIAIAPNDGADSMTLLKNADLALYHAKTDGKGTYHFFEASLDKEARRRRQIEMDLRSAVRDGGLAIRN